MIDTSTIALLRRSRGLLLDTNILLLDVVGRLGEERLTTFKRTRQFEWADFECLNEVLRMSNQWVTTPHVLAETSNLLGQLPSRELENARAILLQRVALVSEEWIAVEKAVADSHLFMRLGVADWALLRLAQQGVFVLSDDAILCDRIWRFGLENAVNFRHLRPFDE